MTDESASISEYFGGQREVEYTDTLPPDAISDELRPTIEELGLKDCCRQLALEGWTVVENAAQLDFSERLRTVILDVCETNAKGEGGGFMLLGRDPVFAEATLNPKLMAMAEFSVGRGFLLSQVAASIRAKGGASIPLHADNNYLPAPFPEHNFSVTACWACDDYTKAGGSTLVIPGSQRLRRHPHHHEKAEQAGAIAIECPAGSVALWDGNIWHANWPRTIEGQRVVCHITYSRLAMRPVEDYSPKAEELIATYGERMTQLLGRGDSLFKQNGFDTTKLVETFNAAKR